MSMTDPIADFLTRIRHGLHADRDDVEMPASTFKAEVARSCASRATSRASQSKPARVGRMLRVRLKYTEDREP